MRIDGHAHGCGEYLTIEGIKETLGRNKVDVVVLVPGELDSTKTYNLKNNAAKHPNKDVLMTTNRLTKGIIGMIGAIKTIPKGNEYIFSLKQQAPNLIKQFYWTTQKQPTAIEDDYAKMQFDGVKVHQCWEGFGVEGVWFDSIAKFCIKQDLPLFAHLYSHKDIKKLIAYIKKNSTLKVIVGHNFGMEYFMMDDLHHFRNVYFDMSNAYFVSKERIQKAYEHFGSKKLLMGSDTPYGLNALEESIKLIENLNINEDEKADILGLNMKMLLKE